MSSRDRDDTEDENDASDENEDMEESSHNSPPRGNSGVDQPANDAASADNAVDTGAGSSTGLNSGTELNSGTDLNSGADLNSGTDLNSQTGMNSAATNGADEDTDVDGSAGPSTASTGVESGAVGTFKGDKMSHEAFPVTSMSRTSRGEGHKKRGRTADVWEHVVPSVVSENEKVNKCKYCTRVFARNNTDTIRKHLRKNHSSIYNRMESEHVIDSKATIRRVTSVSRRRTADVWTYVQEIESNDQKFFKCKFCSRTFEKENTDTIRKHLKRNHASVYRLDDEPGSLSTVANDKITSALLKWLVRESHSVDIVEQQDFAEFVATLNPFYTLPNRDEMRQRLIGLTSHLE